MGGLELEVVVGGTDGSPYPVRAEWRAARILHKAVGVAAARIRLIHEDQLAGRHISLING